MKIIFENKYSPRIQRIVFPVAAFGGFGYIFFKEGVPFSGIGTFILSVIFMLWLFLIINGQADELYIESNGIRIISFFGITHFIKYKDLIIFAGTKLYGGRLIGILALKHHFFPLYFTGSTETSLTAQAMFSNLEKMSGKMRNAIYIGGNPHV